MGCRVSKNALKYVIPATLIKSSLAAAGSRQLKVNTFWNSLQIESWKITTANVESVSHCIHSIHRLVTHLHSAQLWDLLLSVRNRNRKPSWRKGYTRQRRHSKMAVSCHLGLYLTGNSAIRSTDPQSPSIEPSTEWIGCTVFEIFTFKLYHDLETGVQGHSRSSKVALFERAHMTLYSSSIVTMPLSITISKI